MSHELAGRPVRRSLAIGARSRAELDFFAGDAVSSSRRLRGRDLVDARGSRCIFGEQMHSPIAMLENRENSAQSPKNSLGFHESHAIGPFPHRGGRAVDVGERERTCNKRKKGTVLMQRGYSEDPELA